MMIKKIDDQEYQTQELREELKNLKIKDPFD